MNYYGDSKLLRRSIFNTAGSFGAGAGTEPEPETGAALRTVPYIQGRFHITIRVPTKI